MNLSKNAGLVRKSRQAEAGIESVAWVINVILKCFGLKLSADGIEMLTRKLACKSNNNNIESGACLVKYISGCRTPAE